MIAIAASIVAFCIVAYAVVLGGAAVLLMLTAFFKLVWEIVTLPVAFYRGYQAGKRK